ncbi:hypothetical protein [Gordonia sp. NB41Y]|uniref:hypothetical protein n=1 Tax=Gordonia sp. NB41Y TaxID=875808 RepID=UPI0006B23213|nr:hypothetical protein [Gordonia sp. NB41Y]KOY49898.1 hypothetical protein ISGA_07245 [Gordonia sp. NB41Y]WLP91051.1 hypothetical protein Q9K23_01810 [Gordonia sp. NB41Y]
MISITAVCDTAHLDALEFRRGIEAAYAYLGALPIPWARHHAVSTLAEPPRDVGPPQHAAERGPGEASTTDVHDAESDLAASSYSRGYRAALHGFLRDGPRL